MKQIKLICLSAVIFLSSCGSQDKPTKTSVELESIVQYLADNNLTYKTTPEGVYQYVISSNANGKSTGDVYSIYYVLTDLLTSEVIDSYQAVDGDPIKLKRNADAVFPQGFDYGLAGVLEGETYGIILPQSLGYVDFRVPDVPIGTVLHFVVEVVSREKESNVSSNEDVLINNYVLANNLNNTITNPIDMVKNLANGVYYKRTEIGNGIQVASGDSTTLNYKGTLLDDSSFDDLSEFKYLFNSNGVIPGLDIGITKMEQGERATLFIPSAQAYGAAVRVIPQSSIDDLIEQFAIPDFAARVNPYEVLVFDVTLQTIH